MHYILTAFFISTCEHSDPFLRALGTAENINLFLAELSNEDVTVKQYPVHFTSDTCRLDAKKPGKVR